MMEIISKSVQGKSNLRFGIGHANSLETAVWYKEEIRKHFHPEDIIVSDISPALGAHGGPGAIAIAYIGD